MPRELCVTPLSELVRDNRALRPPALASGKETAHKAFWGRTPRTVGPPTTVNEIGDVVVAILLTAFFLFGGWIAWARTSPWPPTFQLRPIATLVADPTYHNPGNLVQQLSTQPGWEQRERPRRVEILDSEGHQHYYTPFYHE